MIVRQFWYFYSPIVLLIDRLDSSWLTFIIPLYLHLNPLLFFFWLDWVWDLLVRLRWLVILASSFLFLFSFRSHVFVGSHRSTFHPLFSSGIDLGLSDVCHTIYPWFANFLLCFDFWMDVFIHRVHIYIYINTIFILQVLILSSPRFNRPFLSPPLPHPTACIWRVFPLLCSYPI